MEGKSRKTFVFVLGLLTAIGAFIANQAGIDLDISAIGIALIGIISYLQFQAKADIKKIQQLNKWRDPKFWSQIIAIALAQIDGFFKLGLPLAEVSGILTVIIGSVFGKLLIKSPK